MATERNRNWVFLLYPDSMPEDYKEYIETKIMAPVYISPVHDQDVKPDGSLKKPHYHCVVTFKGVKTYEQVKELLAPLGGPIPQPCADIGGALRYLCHLDCDDKVHYDPQEVQQLNGADYLEGIFTISDDKRIKRDIKQFVIENQVFYYSDLSVYATRFNPEWENCIDRNSVFWVSFLKSLYTKYDRHEITFLDELENVDET